MPRRWWLGVTHGCCRGKSVQMAGLIDSRRFPVDSDEVTENSLWPRQAPRLRLDGRFFRRCQWCWRIAGIRRGRLRANDDIAVGRHATSLSNRTCFSGVAKHLLRATPKVQNVCRGLRRRRPERSRAVTPPGFLEETRNDGQENRPIRAAVLRSCGPLGVPTAPEWRSQSVKSLRRLPWRGSFAVLTQSHISTTKVGGAGRGSGQPR